MHVLRAHNSGISLGLSLAFTEVIEKDEPSKFNGWTVDVGLFDYRGELREDRPFARFYFFYRKNEDI